MNPKIRCTSRAVGWIVAALLGCGISSAWGQAPPAAPAVPEYVTADAFAMLDVRWGEFRKVPFWNYMFRSRIQVRFEQINGPEAPITKFCNGLWNLDELESIRLVFDAGPLGTLPVGGYAVIRLSRPFDLPTLTADRLGLAAPQEHRIDGLKYRTYKNLGTPEEWNGPLAILSIDDRTVLLAPESSLKKILAAKAGTGPLSEHWKGSPDATGFRFAAVSTETTRGLISLLLLGGGKANFREPFEGMPALLPQIRAIDLRADSNGKKLCELAFRMKDEAAGKGMVEQLERYRKIQRTFVERDIRINALQLGSEKRLPFMKEYSTALTVRLRGTTAEVELPEFRTLPSAVESWIEQDREEALFEKRYDADSEGPDSEDDISWMFRLPRVTRAMRDFIQDRKKMPADISSADGKPLLSWRVAILPYIGLSKLHEKFKLNEAWDSPHNKPLLKELNFYSSDPAKPNETLIFLFRGPGTPFPMGGRKVVPADIKDGLANTLALTLAAPDRSVPWSKPADIDFDPARFSETLRALPDDCDWAFTLLDGNWGGTKRLKPDVLKALITANGGEKIDVEALFGPPQEDEE